MNNVTVFKIRIDSVSETAIKFEIMVGDKVSDAYINMLASGNYGVNNRLVLTPKQFTDFALRLVAYVYTEKSVESFNNEQIETLWNMKINIFNNYVQQISSSIFDSSAIRSKLLNLKLIK